MTPSNTTVRRPVFRFPRAWLWWVDESIPTYVKQQYSPKESWKDKPFSREDALFFSKGVIELSSLFTEDRPQTSRGMPLYFHHPKYRSSYLLYFLPLQAAKFLTLFQKHPEALRAAVEHGRNQGALRILDLGAGPGTASLAVLLALLDLPADEEIPPIELHWFDTDKSILHDGRHLVEQLASHFPRLRGKVSIELSAEHWWKAPSRISEPTSLVLLGNVLNEAPGTSDRSNDALKALVEQAEGGGVLFVEPAARFPSQLLSRVRDTLLALEPESESEGPSSEKRTAIWGPCPHLEGCPLAQGRDWCHFSVPVEIPGEWFRFFSKALGSERRWLKYSYVWMTGTRTTAKPKAPPKGMRLVISDPIEFGPHVRGVLVCEPEVPRKIRISELSRVSRGDWIPLDPLASGSHPKPVGVRPPRKSKSKPRPR